MAADLRTTTGIYLLFLSIYLVSAAGHFFSTDHIGVYLTAQSLVERHSLAIKPINDAARGRDGQYYGAFGLGQSLAVLPLSLRERAQEQRVMPDLLPSGSCRESFEHRPLWPCQSPSDADGEPIPRGAGGIQ